MDRNRRSIRYVESTDDSNRASTINPARVSTVDSGRGSMATSDRTSAVESIMTNGASSSLSRGTPLDGNDDGIHENHQNDQPVRIHCTRTLGHKCYEQAFVSHIDHPSAFFLQLAHFQSEFEKLQEEIKEFYSKTPMVNVSESWKRGDYCVAKFIDDKFYRARIIEVPRVTKTHDLYDVLFVDYGNWDKVASTDIHIIQPKFAILTAQAIPCSLAKSLPPSGTWFDHPKAMDLFKELVLEQYVDATFSLKTSRDFWQLSFVDLTISSTKLNVRQHMTEKDLIRAVDNDKIYLEFHHLLTLADYIIYSISYEGEENDDDDDY